MWWVRREVRGFVVCVRDSERVEVVSEGLRFWRAVWRVVAVVERGLGVCWGQTVEDFWVVWMGCGEREDVRRAS